MSNGRRNSFAGVSTGIKKGSKARVKRSMSVVAEILNEEPVRTRRYTQWSTKSQANSEDSSKTEESSTLSLKIKPKTSGESADNITAETSSLAIGNDVSTIVEGRDVE